MTWQPSSRPEPGTSRQRPMVGVGDFYAPRLLKGMGLLDPRTPKGS